MAESAIDLAAGGCSGVVSACVGYPFETVLVLMQSHKLAAHTTYRDCVTQLYQREGVRGFYKGIPPRLLASGLDCSLTFGGYKAGLRLVGASEEDLRVRDVCAGGLGGGLATTAVLTPLELIECRLQVSAGATSGAGVASSAVSAPHASSAVATARPPLTVWRCVRQVYRHEGGLRGFYQSGLATLLREIPGTTLWCGTNSALRALVTPPEGSVDDLGLRERVLCGGLSGLLYSVVLYPVDLLKTRIQTEPTRYRHFGFAQAMAAQYRACGLRSFYRGFGLVAVCSFPSSALAFVSYDYFWHALISSAGTPWAAPRP